MNEGTETIEPGKKEKQKINWAQLWNKEDWIAVWIGFLMIGAAVVGLIKRPTLPRRWGPGREGAETILGSIPLDIVPALLFTGLLILCLFAIAVFFTDRQSLKKFLIAFPVIFILAIIAEAIGNYAPWRHYGFNNVIWALAIGMLISNTIKTPAFLKGAIRTELYIKTGLVLLGSSILFNRILALGLKGLGVAWMVTPVVLIFMYWFSQKVLKMQEHKSLSMVVAAATSVCGVSAAIATGAAAKAKKEEISLAISISLIFTAIMMIVMPVFVNLLGLSPAAGGAWLGGTIDSTGAVAAAGAILGGEALEVAVLVKMIQNILIGVIAFGVAIFFVTKVERKSASEAEVGPSEIWTRTPKFILGFIGASLIFSFLLPKDTVSVTLPIVDAFREFFFTLTFVSIGLESNFKEMAQMAKGGKPLNLYILGQLFNIILTLAAAYIFFGFR